MSAQKVALSAVIVWLAICSRSVGATSCYTSTFTRSNGTLSSPNWPSYYSNSQSCSWTITVPRALKLILVVDSFDMETCCDHVRISAEQIYRSLTGTATIKVPGNTVNVRFSTDGSVTRNGFSMTWIAFYGYNCTIGGDECDEHAHCGNVTGSTICVCNTGYDGDGLLCTPKNCGSPTIAGHSCTSNSTTYPNTATCSCAEGYENNGTSFTIDCLSTGNWSTATNNRNYTRCQKVSCGPPPVVPNSNPVSSYNLENSFQDIVTYYCRTGYTISEGSPSVQCGADGNWTTPPTSCTRVRCGTLPRVYNSDPDATVQTGNEYQDTAVYSCLSGYEIRDGRYSVVCQYSGYWSPAPVCSSGIVCGSGYFTQTTGRITSPGYPGGYANDLNCGWVIAPPLARGIKLTVEQMNVESCCDHLYVSSPNSSRSELSGPTITELTGNAVTLTFTSDGSVTGRGWTITWEATVLQNCTLHSDDCDENAQCVNSSGSQICMCNEGYEGDGRICQGRDCGDFPLIDEVSCSSNSTRHPSNATCNCSPGYDEVVSSPFTITCESDGYWHAAAGNRTVCTKVSCGTPPTVDNSDTLSTYQTGEEYLDTVTYQCLQGYVINSTTSSVTCQANRTWTTPPTCTEVFCGAPPVVSYANQTVQTGSKYQDRVVYTCQPGYEDSSGNYASYCGANGRWYPTPRCSYGIRCNSGFYTNSTGTVTSINYPDRYNNGLNCGWTISPQSAASIILIVDAFNVEYCCDHLRYAQPTGPSYDLRSTGTYEIQGNEVRLTFTSDGSVTYNGWSIRWIALVTCTVGQSECGVNAECTNSSGSYTCRCNEGYEGDGLTCLGKDCGSPILSGVTCSGNQTRYPNTVSCDCLPGYERANSQFNLTCGNTGVWSMPSDNITAVCTRVDCGTPPVVAYSNAQATYRTGTEYQDRVTFSCISGYEISTEPNYVVCLANRTWSPLPVCTKVNCGPPPDVRNIDNQTTVQNGTRFGDQVTYTCLPGYEMFTEFSSVECLADGRWSGTPRCTTKDCGPVPPATGINCTSFSTMYPSNATCSCNTGYERFNQQYTVNCQTSGTWSSPQDDHPPRCEKVDCGIPPVVDNSESQASIQTGTKYGDRVTYMCLQGYEDEHNLTSITCQASGQWSTAPTCLRISCGTPPTIQHMDTQATVQSGTKYEDTVEYYCLPGYLVQSGTRSIRCQSTKQWTEPPSCTKLDCGTPPDVENGALNRRQYNTTFDSEVTYKCDGHQYNMIGSATVRCTEDGTWSTPPICHDVNCGAPPNVDNSNKQVSGHSYNDTVRYECDVGYTLEGNSTIVCQVIGHWTVPPVCVELPCGDPPEIENTKGFPIVTGTTVGAEARYSCKTGYVMSGEPVIECQVNQQWSINPQCNRIRCGEPPDVQNALKSVGGHYLNDSTEYECRIGYLRIGNELIFCQADGHWTVAPTCDVLSCGVPPTPKNSGLVSLAGTEFGNTATYKCLTGFSTDDPKYITCQLNGTWSRAPNCTEGSSKDSGKSGVPSSVNNQQDNKSAAKSQNLSSSSTTLIICMSLLSIVVIALVIVGAFCYLSKRKRDFFPTSLTNATYEAGDFGETDAVL